MPTLSLADDPLAGLDAADPSLLKALAHSVRRRILQHLLSHPTTSAVELERTWKPEVTLGTASYHLRKLASLGFVELVAQLQRRGAIEHRYALTTTGRTQLASLQPRSERPLSLPNVGSALRQLRERSGTSHTQLARAVGIDRSRIVAIEEGRDDPSVQTVINITAVLGGTLSVVVA